MIPASYFFKRAYSRAWLETAEVKSLSSQANSQKRHLGKILMTLRDASHLTKRDLAARAAMTETAVSRIEAADDAPLSAIVSYMCSLGGGVELVLKTPDGSATSIAFSPEVASCAAPANQMLSRPKYELTPAQCADVPFR